MGFIADRVDVPDVIGIVASEADEASLLIREQLLDLADWEIDSGPDDTVPVRRTAGARLCTVEELHLETRDVAGRLGDPEAVVFVSRHAGDTGRLLTAHFTGNYGEAEYGGEPRSLAPAAPGLLGPVLEGLRKVAPTDYDVSMECTHHGPTTVGAPSMYVELGSGPEQWADTDAANAVARATLDLRDHPVRPPRTVVGFGGGHYAPRLTRIATETDWSVGHVCADWALDTLDARETRERLVRETFERSGATRAFVEGDRPDVKADIRSNGYRVVGESWLRETTGVRLPTVDAVESALGAAADDVRFGRLARSDDPDRSSRPPTMSIVRVPEGPLSAAAAVDRESTWEAIEAATLAFETRDNGTSVGDRAAVPAESTRRDLVDTLVPVLEREYDVEWSNDRLRLRRREFDPELARAAGVPEGPAFGRLADGESVRVNNTEVRPEDVTRIRTKEFRL